MGKESITHTCGHTVVVQLLGPMRRREIERQQRESRDCSDCRRSSHASAAAARAAEAGLPALAGTDKQVAWALRIRDGMRPEIIAAAVRLEAETGEAGEGVVAEALARLLGETSASWWIEHRPQTDMIGKMAAELGAAPTARSLLRDAVLAVARDRGLLP